MMKVNVTACSNNVIELWHDKTNKMSVRPAKIQISLGICPVWSESSLSAWRKFGSLAIHWTHREDSDQTGRMPRLICVFAGRTLILLVLSCRDSTGLYNFIFVPLFFLSLPHTWEKSHRIVTKVQTLWHYILQLLEISRLFYTILSPNWPYFNSFKCYPVGIYQSSLN